MLIEEFIERWKDTEASERANKDSFLKELCRALGVREPDGKTGDIERDVYVFEADSVLYDEDGRRRVGSMDLYKKGCFVLEAKQGSTRKGKKTGTARRDAPGWGIAMNDAHGQALGYAKTLENPPPFVIVADIGYCFDLYACFDGSGAYSPYPNGQKHRLYFKNLAQHADLLRTIWLDPFNLDPSKRSRAVTIDVSEKLAELAKGLEREHPPEKVAKFLMRCVFCMFAEDIGLLRDKVFTQALEKQWLPEPESFKDGVEALWEAMNEGKRFFILGKLLRFNGGLFADSEALPLSAAQLGTLLSAAKREWSEVQPAIFGTLIERALDEKERHNLGAHFTPASYVERLLRPTIEEPLREEWDGVRALVRQLVPPNEEAKRSEVKKAQDLVIDFHKKLCETTVLDPACGSGNFLYLALDLFKRMESEVLAMLHDLGVRQLDFAEQTVTPRQFKGIEIRRQSKEIAELVLWIGYLQWHHKMYGQTKNPPEPILRDYQNIECRDALVTQGLARPKGGRPSKTTAAPNGYFVHERSVWPPADFVIGNPPFIGNKRMRAALGNAYVDVLRQTWNNVPESADLVMYWWHHAAELTRRGELRRFGLITTNSIRQPFNRRAMAPHFEGSPPLSLAFAIPDHPWIDSRDGADVRIAMTVGAVGATHGVLGIAHEQITDERPTVEVRLTVGQIHPDLSVGAQMTSLATLSANRALSFRGVIPHGENFVLDSETACSLGLGKIPGLERHIRVYRNGRDLTQAPREKLVIDLFPLDIRDVRDRFPELHQWLLERVFPEREKQTDKRLREKWWLHRRDNEEMRQSLHGLKRYIATPQTAKHRFFVFLDADVVPDDKLIAIGLADDFCFGVLSSRVHQVWALRTGARLGVGNDPVYNKTACFDAFPFPSANGATADRVRDAASRLDRHRTRQKTLHPELTFTGMYNALERLRVGTPSNAEEQKLHKKALCRVLAELHDELDAAVLDAYGWPHDLSDDQVLEHLVELNQERAAEEAVGHVRWIRPEYQKGLKSEAKKASKAKHVDSRQLSFVWPDTLPEQVTTVRSVVGSSAAALSAADVSAACSGASVEMVIPVLETLEALGHFISFKDGEKRWASLARVANDRSSGPGVRKVSSAPPAEKTKSA